MHRNLYGSRGGHGPPWPILGSASGRRRAPVAAAGEEAVDYLCVDLSVAHALPQPRPRSTSTSRMTSSSTLRLVRRRSRKRKTCVEDNSAVSAGGSHPTPQTSLPRPPQRPLTDATAGDGGYPVTSPASLQAVPLPPSRSHPVSGSCAQPGRSTPADKDVLPSRRDPHGEVLHRPTFSLATGRPRAAAPLRRLRATGRNSPSSQPQRTDERDKIEYKVANFCQKTPLRPNKSDLKLASRNSYIKHPSDQQAQAFLQNKLII
jgi:hypothetical protein